MGRQWILNDQKGFEDSLEYQENVRSLSADDLGPNDVLVEIHAASLNYRELQIARPNSINGPIQVPVVPGCDGAGIVKAVGSSVQEFQPGDRVITKTAPKVAESRGDDAYSTVADVFPMLGQGTDGTLRSEGIFSQWGLVHAPKSLGWLESATLTCTWGTAWNVLFGVKGRDVGPGTWVLVQGTGGVSVAVLQLAVAAGASVIATTSTEEKAARLRELGAAGTVNYTSNPAWGAEARILTPDGRGFDIVADVGGNETLPQSLAAVRVDGVVSVVGGVGDAAAASVPLFAVLLSTCIVRGFLGSSRSQLREVARYIDEKNIKPAVDDVVFELAEAKDAYRRLEEKKHFAKVVIRVDHLEG
ncbi:related to alcohol dehydrogenase [Cephalotrichum gorgonifer]|uniref:Related to alcohol dehydrogenase n=1 Tax=Cephalotrichum gorgonifer TaxID=2041049 RepID=A0AAE8MWC2_9PEZI|nr:related to alcohol dehydrogenase [Cephalotrichum gorgonifer]